MFRKLTKRKLITKARVAIAVSSLFLIFFSVGLVKELINRQQINKQITGLENEIAALEKENQEIGNLISNWSESNRLEKEARLKLGLKKPNEQAVIIMRPDQPDKAPKNTIQQGDQIIGGIIIPNDQQEVSNPIKWWRYFFQPES